MALDLIERGFVLAPESASLADAYHAAVTAEEAWERAGRVLAESRALHPTNRRIAFYLIDVLLRAGRYAEAMDHIEHSMLAFGIDDGVLAAALDVRGKVGLAHASAVARLLRVFPCA